MIAALVDLAYDETGGALIEYAMVLALVSMVALAALEGFGKVLQDFFKASSEGLANVAAQAK